MSTWIDYKHYAPHHLKDNPQTSDADLLACETTRSGRLRQTKALLDYLRQQSLTTLKAPLLVGGDWNCPSHLDWTDATAKAFPFRRSLPGLPVSKAMEQAKFIDVYRAIHPNPVASPGNTWSPLFRVKNGKDMPMDRIDRLYYRSNRPEPLLKPLRATVYPETLEDKAIPVAKRQFPSDHAALLIEFKWQN